MVSYVIKVSLEGFFEAVSINQCFAHVGNGKGEASRLHKQIEANLTQNSKNVDTRAEQKWIYVVVYVLLCHSLIDSSIQKIREVSPHICFGSYVFCGASKVLYIVYGLCPLVKLSLLCDEVSSRSFETTCQGGCGIRRVSPECVCGTEC